MIATVIHEEIPSASWAKTLAIQDLPVGLPLENLSESYSFSSPATSVLAREFRGLTNGSHARGVFYAAANQVSSFGGLDELSAVTANSYRGQGAVELAFEQQAPTLEARDCAVPFPKKLAEKFFAWR